MALDPGRFGVAGLPLLSALAHVGRVESVVTRAPAWGGAPHALAAACFASGDAPAASRLSEVFTGAAALFRSDDDPDDAVPGWWLDAQGDGGLRLRATLDVLTLAQHLPWPAAPGSLADLATVDRP